MSFAFGPAGHIEKYQRISIIRPMRVFFYLDSEFWRYGAGLWACMAVALFLIEVRTVRFQ